MKFLVFGFSVTAEAGGYVDRCAALRSAAHPEDEILKVAIGGLQPDHARHLMKDIINKHAPDALIIEIATAVYRLRAGTPLQIADHTAGMEAMFSICKDRDLRCGILDLPLMGVVDQKDWMVQTNSNLARTYNVPHRIVPQIEGTLRDIVHPNDEGKTLYAALLCDLVSAVCRTKSDFSSLRPAREFGAFALKGLDLPGAVYRDFSRAGFDAKMLMIQEGETLEVPLPNPVTTTGLIVRMGPTSGTFLIRRGDEADRMHCYDRHCYYERVLGKPLKPVSTGKVSIFQDGTLPQEELVKGSKDEGARLGGVTHVLYETTLPQLT